MARSPLLLAACLLACCAPLALAGDRILPTVTPACKDQFSTIIKEHYAGDAECSDMIRKAMNTAPKTAADCPGGKEAGAGSAVQKCMSKNEVRRTEAVVGSSGSSGSSQLTGDASHSSRPASSNER
jgi:hypothetical protein